MAATRTIKIASVAVRPVVIIALAAVHVDTVTKSEYQYPMNAQLVQVRLSSGTGS